MKRRIKKGLYPPVITNTISGRYLVIDGKWELVSEDFSLKDIEIYEEKKEVKLNIYEVESSSFEGETYIIRQDGDKWTCTCMGYNRLKNKDQGCKHIRKIKEKLLC